MALYFDLTQPGGEVSRIELKPGMQRLRVLAGDHYRLIDEQGNTPAGLVVRRYDNHILIDDAKSGIEVELTDYYGRCSVSAPCVIEMGAADGTEVQITPASQPVRALTDGSFVLYQTDGGAGGIAPLAAPSGSTYGGESSGVNGWVIGGGVLGLLAIAGAAGGGGGGSDSPAAVSPPPPAPQPQPQPGDTTPPAQPVLTSAAASNTSHPVLIGQAEAGSTVRAAYDLNRDGTPDVVYQTTAAADGSFRIDLGTARPTSGSLPANGLPDGRVTVTVVAIDASNNQSTAVSQNLEISATPPDAPRITSVTDDSGAVTGPVANGERTDDLTPTLGGTLPHALGTGERLVILRNGAEIATLSSINGTSWSFQDSGLALGQTYVYEARVVNAAGNTSSSSNEWQIRTGSDPAPTFPTVQITGVTDNQAPVTGNVANGGATNDRTPTIVGQLSAVLGPGQTVEILRNGQPTTLQATVDGRGFTATDTLPGDGSYTYTARVVQGTGGAGTASAAYAIVVDTVNTTAAGITAITDNVAPGTGTIANGAQTNDTTPTLSGTVSTALASGERLEILRDGQVVHEITSTPSGRWSWTDSGLRVGQDYSYTVRVVDAAGNVGATSAAYRIRVVATQRDDDPTDPTDPGAIGVVDPTDQADPDHPVDPTQPATADPLLAGQAAEATTVMATSLGLTGAWLLPASAGPAAPAASAEPAPATSAAAGGQADAAAAQGSAPASTVVTLHDLVGPTAPALLTANGSGDLVTPAAESTGTALDRLLETA